VQDLALGQLRLAHPADLGDLFFLLVREEGRCGLSALAVALLQLLECELVRALGCVAHEDPFTL